MKKIIMLLSIFFLCKISMAQKFEKVCLNAKDTTSNFYIIVYPSKLPYNGYMFLIQGMYQEAEDVFIQTELPMYAAQQGILTIIPIFKTGISSLGIDSATQASFLEILNHVTSKHKLIGQPFYVGGFSIGGTCAIKYAELALRNNYPIKPAAVFAIDSPLDFERFYNTILRETRLPVSTDNSQAEIKYMLNRFVNEFEGSPSTNLLNYQKMSPYSFTDTMQYAIKPLANLPLRFYTEPDVSWWLKDGADYSGMNAFDLAAMTNELIRMGNTKVELITTENKGYRKPDNERHPHSWSIAEPKDLVKWLQSQR